LGKPRPDKNQFLNRVKPLGGLERLFSMRGRYEREIKEAENQFEEALRAFESSESVRLQKLRALEAAHRLANDSKLEAIRLQNADIDQFAEAYRVGDLSAVTAYYSTVLQRSAYPEDFPQDFRVAYVPESKQLVVEYQMPTADVVPKNAEYRYIKTKDMI